MNKFDLWCQEDDMEQDRPCLEHTKRMLDKMEKEMGRVELKKLLEDLLTMLNQSNR